MPHSRFMFHTGLWGGEFTGTQAETEYQMFEKDQKVMLDIYVDAMQTFGKKATLESCMEEARMSRQLLKKPETDDTRELLSDWLYIQMKLKEEVYLEPDEAMNLGFADAILVGDWQSLKEEDAKEDQETDETE